MRHVFLVVMTCGVFLIGLPHVTADEPHVIRITMTANAEGGLAELILNGDVIPRPKNGKRTRLYVLQSRIRGLVEDPKGRRKDKDFEAEVECDRNLQYKHVIEVITAVSGYKPECSDEVVKLIDKIKFVAAHAKADSP